MYMTPGLRLPQGDNQRTKVLEQSDTSKKAEIERRIALLEGKCTVLEDNMSDGTSKPATTGTKVGGPGTKVAVPNTKAAATEHVAMVSKRLLSLEQTSYLARISMADPQLSITKAFALAEQEIARNKSGPMQEANDFASILAGLPELTVQD